MDITHILQDFLMLGIPLIIGLQTWIIKEIYSLKKWQASKTEEIKNYASYQKRLIKLEEWLIRSEALTMPDKELRKELPVALEILKQHGGELQTMRESLLLTQKEITVKLESIVVAIKDIQGNCIMHKMVTAGKADILANFINKEINEKLRDT